MVGSPHYKELLQLLHDHQVEYLIVGGYAVMKYTEPRYTKDLDLWVHNSPQNSVALFHSLAEFGAPLNRDGVTPETFTQDQITYQIGIAPVRIDILTHISGVHFQDAWRKRVESTFFGVPVQFISLDDLIANKKAAGRSGDLEHLEQIRKKQ
ncbi:MAG TPA: nucleotidyltransferase [Terriglobia bacterium]|nr:nucleotidyltransferase [Terriglobia bacterium]